MTYSSSEASQITGECSSDCEVPAPPPADSSLQLHGCRQVPIAVVGMACRLPGHSSSPTALWDLLQRGGIAKNEPPPSRFNLAGHHDQHRRPRTMKSPGGMFMEDFDPEEFDGQFFNISRTDCIAMDPQQRQLLEVAYECLENGGISLESISGKPVGCIVGVNLVDYNSMQSRDPEDRPESATIGVATSLLSNRISHFLNANGPSMTLDTACSASLVSVDVACRYLGSYQASGVLVAGTNMWLNPEHNQETGMMRMTQSASGKCHTFDASADGYVKAEGINAVYLKRLDDAIRDSDPIRAVIRGTAANSSGRTPGIANPSSEAQARAIRTAYANAGMTDFNKTGFLECHGTGTLAGDPIEVNGVASVFAKTRKKGQELIIGSIKSNIGHSEAAAGISGLMKAVLSVERGVIPGNPTFINPNPKIDFTASKVRATRISIKWPGSPGRRRASVNSFGFGGANAHVVLENADSTHVSSYKQISADFFADDDEDENTVAQHATPTLLVFSANDEKSLKDYIQSLSAHLINPSTSINVGDLAYTLSERRSRLYCRGFTSVRGSNIQRDIQQENIVFGKKAPCAPNVGFVFTGQGAQWSQMGLDLVKSFPRAKKAIEDMDKILQALPDGPKWSLLRELIETRSSEALRQPEFSQPLVTALQIALVDVLCGWGISPKTVVGHSSGEIAAAAAAGLITREEAIKTAYYRGQAAKRLPPSQRVGMLAVGVSAEMVEESYLKDVDGKVEIACYNSPSSLTLSGPVSDLEKVRDQIQQDGHFARMLLVDLAYHSKYMTDIGSIYAKMLLDNCNSPKKKGNGVRMFSSVTGSLMSTAPDHTYWKSNMVSPVRFAQAAINLLTEGGEEATDFLVEIGPSNALSGPISQIKKSLPGSAANARYTAALKRGTDSILPLYDVAGQLFLAGGPVDLSRVNRKPGSKKPSVIVDLPNYAWNRSGYWHETQASKDWRFKKFIMHDLLGSKMNGTPWQSPVFKKTLKLADLTWLKDHCLGNQVVFPAAGYVAMAVEGMYQTAMMTQWKEQRPSRYRYRLRDVKFSRALTIDENVETRYAMSLTPMRGGSTRLWYEFKVSSSSESTFAEHCTGSVCVETDYTDEPAPASAIEPLKFPTPGRSWYKAMADNGYIYGKAFQKQLMVESTTGQMRSRSLVSMVPPESSYGQSHYPIHPACIDGCFQTLAPALWRGDKSTVGAALVPSVLSSIVIAARDEQPAEAISVASGRFLGIGRKDSLRNCSGSCSVYDPKDGSLLFQLNDLQCAELETTEDESAKHTFTHLAWEADIKMLLSAPQSRIREYISENGKSTQDIIDMIAHKHPMLKVLELNLGPEDSSSLWIQENARPIRAACSQYHLAVTSPSTLVASQEAYSILVPNIGFSLLDLSKLEAVTSDTKYDFSIVKVPGATSQKELESILDIVAKSVKEDGLILNIGKAMNLERLGKKYDLGEESYICLREVNGSDSQLPKISYVSLLEQERKSSIEALNSLRENGWDIERIYSPKSAITTSRPVLILDEMTDSLMDRLSSEQWAVLKHLVELECSILWVTCGAHLDVTDPTRAAISGLFRTIRAESPVHLVTLDVGQPAGPTTIEAISFCLDVLCKPRPKQSDSEYVERDGVIRISRLLPDTVLTGMQSDEPSESKVDTLDLHAAETTIQLRTEQLGNIESIRFGEMAPEPVPLAEGRVEVEIYAAGMNYKDVVVAMGIVPGDELVLGGEAAGVVTQISSGVTGFEIGQRVVFLGRGCFANRAQVTPARVHPIPDWMSFEEAATLCGVYLTSIYSLFDMANLRTGQRVLIHSAAGGVGIASIQLARYIGAEIFVTVGTAEKREFLKSTFGIADDHIFNSRNTDFASQIMAATNGEGVDVVLNSLTGDMLDESFRILSDRGTMVEIGKKDILDRGSLPMEPFDRNISFRAVDMSYERSPDPLVARLMSQLFELVHGGHVAPINPIHRFSFADIPSAIRFLRAGRHIGKIVITDGPDAVVEVPVRRAPRALHLRSDVCYLIVGGLKGLCGSLAVYLAKSGAKHLAVISRSGHSDQRSQGIVREINALGAQIDLLTADVCSAKDVERAFEQTTIRIGGIIQGAMVLRDRPFDTMTIEEYHGAIACKIQGTWNLHQAAEKMNLSLDFFTMLSSVSGVVGQRGQANYSAANVFLDSFASYRRRLNKAACSVNLGVIEDSGYIAENEGFQQKHFDQRIWKGINDRLLRRILHLSLLQQEDPPPSPEASGQMISGITVPQPGDSSLLRDARFASLFATREAAGAVDLNAKGADRDIQALLMMFRSEKSDPAALLAATVDVVNKGFQRILRLSEPMDPARPLAVHGIDSLAAVEVRNWIRAELGAVVTTLDIMNAPSLVSLCEKVVAKVMAKH
ncbi:hypothetical protein DL771_010199 [Monosporascus sp. 5C6A]|nr:hypothetical protein DL771_010199 [Monosporascus sp. 5C6A]